MSPATNVEPAGREPGDDKHAGLKALAATYGLAILGTAIAVAALLAAMRYLQAHHASLAAVLTVTAIYGVAVVGVAWGATWVGRRFIKRKRQSPAMQRYVRRMMISQVFYIATLVIAVGAYKALPHGSPLMWPAAIAPAVPIIAWIVFMASYFREEPDEFERAVQVESALWATGGLLAVTTVWGFLEMFDLLPHVPAWAAFPLWAVLLGPSQLIVRRRYR